MNSFARFRAAGRLQGHLLFKEAIGTVTLCLFEIRQRAVPLRAVADDGRRLAVTRTEAELLEGGVEAVVLLGIDAVDLQ